MRGLFCWLLFAPALPSMCHQPVRRYCMARLYLQKAEPPFRRQPLECALLARELVERTIKSQGRFDTQRAQGVGGRLARIAKGAMYIPCLRSVAASVDVE